MQKIDIVKSISHNPRHENFFVATATCQQFEARHSITPGEGSFLPFLRLDLVNYWLQNTQKGVGCLEGWEIVSLKLGYPF